jgi:hypothetical protein
MTDLTKHLLNSLVSLHNRSMVHNSWSSKYGFTCNKENGTVNTVHININNTNRALRVFRLQRLGRDLGLSLPTFFWFHLRYFNLYWPYTYEIPFSESLSTSLFYFSLFLSGRDSSVSITDTRGMHDQRDPISIPAGSKKLFTLPVRPDQLQTTSGVHSAS